MFNFTCDDNFHARRSSYRLTSHKHNPYVGCFHSTNRIDYSLASNIVDNKSPILPMFRHAPPTNKDSPTTVGLKSLIYDDEKLVRPFVTQVQVSRQFNSQTKHLLPDALRSLPLSIFDTSSHSNLDSDSDEPICSICLDCFRDGDELRTLECSHCYHRRCIDIWLIGCLSDENTNTCNCPQCRQIISSSLTNSEIPRNIFMRIGQDMSNVDIASELVSDASSTIELDDWNLSNEVIPVLTQDSSDFPLINDSESPGEHMLGSFYSDCGVPLS